VLGVDDWAKQKGRRYGTILVDLERCQTIDLLEERTAQSLVTWPKDHAGIEIVSRNRSQTYGESIHRRAPGATQVAGRW
jgi:transposase